MAISFQCGQCQQSYQVGDHFAGKQTRCKKCGAVMRVPGGQTPTAPQQPSLGAMPGSSPGYGMQSDPMQAGGYPQGYPNMPAGSIGGQQFGMPGSGFAGQSFGMQMGMPATPQARRKSNKGMKLALIAGGAAAAAILLVVVLVVVAKALFSRPAVAVGGIPSTPAGSNLPTGVSGASAPAAAGQPSSTPATTTSPKAWKSLVDPPPEKFQIPTSMVHIPADEVVASQHGGLEFAFAPYSSPYVAVFEDLRQKVVTLYDMRTNKVVAQSPNLEGADFRFNAILGVHLSQDGKHIANHHLRDESNDKVASVYSFEAAKVTRSWRFAGQSKTLLRFVLGFAGNDRLVVEEMDTTMGIPGPDHLSTTVHVYNVKDGSEVIKFKPPWDVTLQNPAISPGGTYLASPTLQDKIAIMNLAAGTVAAELVVPDTYYHAFSPDGTEFAAMTLRGHLTVWNLANGEISFDHSILDEITKEAYSGEQLEFAPDGNGWLIRGQYFLHRKERRLVGPFGMPTILAAKNDIVLPGSPRRLVDSKHCIFMTVDSKGFHLEVVDIPTE